MTLVMLKREKASRSTCCPSGKKKMKHVKGQHLSSSFPLLSLWSPKSFQKPLEPSKPARTDPVTSNAEGKNLHPETATPPTSQNAIAKTKQLMLGALEQLQTIYNNARKSKAEQITIKRTTFEAIGAGIQQA
jgi:hypothetical protein